MKRLLPFVALAFIITLVACNSAPRVSEIEARIKKYQDSVKFSADTVGLAQFQAWKAQNEIVDANQYNAGAAAVAPAVASAPRSYAPVRRSSGARSVSRSSGSGTRTSESGHTAQASKKRGWSKAAKGTAIGAAGGAIAGAVINKRNRVVGGVVGGVLGGAVGYGIGRSQDKKDGRY